MGGLPTSTIFPHRHDLEGEVALSLNLGHGCSPHAQQQVMRPSIDGASPAHHAPPPPPHTRTHHMRAHHTHTTSTHTPHTHHPLCSPPCTHSAQLAPPPPPLSAVVGPPWVVAGWAVLCEALVLQPHTHFTPWPVPSGLCCALQLIPLMRRAAGMTTSSTSVT